MSIPRFLLPRGLPSAQSLRTLQRKQKVSIAGRRCFSATSPANAKAKKPASSKPRVLEKPDKFRPPSHPQRIVAPRRTAAGQPVNYGAPLTKAARTAQDKKQYPNMFPPEGTVMFKFLTSRWIHVWISLGILTSLATFTFTTNFKASSPFAHLLPPWSALFTSPFDTISKAFQVYRMDVQHNSMLVREQRQGRVQDAEKRRQYRVAHGMEEAAEADKAAVDTHSPVAVDEGLKKGEYVDWEGNRKPVKKWLGIW
ncbi:hypothetical protein N7495_004053 [Penicillium taxi]|uniref:uncharacterized protein n=1 Tax=Penicillium taxi TaxID=168475 RepID=UPI0025451C83|nr:uncharacterized protein N7495_004053 [Penicillium taxi]KAJ5899309.1 hypothetical protein N7495_004053 [Penicillium taxi]